MEICFNWNGTIHDEVVYEGRDCPVCEALDTIDERDTTIIGLEGDFKTLEDEYGELVADLAKANDEDEPATT